MPIKSYTLIFFANTLDWQSKAQRYAALNPKVSDEGKKTL
jgi:hypothetical protein